MEAKDFLAIDRERILRLVIGGFSVYGGYSGLTDLHITEMMSDEPDIAIGNLVVPELTLTFGSGYRKNRAAMLYQTVRVDMGLSQESTDVTEELAALEMWLDPLFVRRSAGGWIIAVTYDSGTVLYNSSGSRRGGLLRPFTGMLLDEKNGRLYLFHDTEPYCTAISADLTGDEETITADGILPDVWADYAAQRAAVTEAADGTVLMVHLGRSIRYQGNARYVDIISAVLTRYSLEAWDNFTITDTALEDEDTMELTAYGELGFLDSIPAEEFFTNAYLSRGMTLLEAYQAFLRWLAAKGHTFTAAQQEWITLDKATLAFDPDGLLSDENKRTQTAGSVLRTFAAIEAGNARLGADGVLTLGWCSRTPKLTIPADVIGSLRLGTDRLTGATGFKFYLPSTSNVIDTELDSSREPLFWLVGATTLGTVVFPNIVAAFSELQMLPFTAEVLEGASPYLRAGDCVRIVSRSGAAVEVQILQAEMSAFPYPTAELSAPDGTTWKTQAVDLDALTVVALVLSGVPEYVLPGEEPDLTALTVTAVQRDGGAFDAVGYQTSLVLQDDAYLLTVSYAGVTAQAEIAVAGEQAVPAAFPIDRIIPLGSIAVGTVFPADRIISVCSVAVGAAGHAQEAEDPGDPGCYRTADGLRYCTSDGRVYRLQEE